MFETLISYNQFLQVPVTIRANFGPYIVFIYISGKIYQIKTIKMAAIRRVQKELENARRSNNRSFRNIQVHAKM